MIYIGAPLRAYEEFSGLGLLDHSFCSELLVFIQSMKRIALNLLIFQFYSYLG
jgi:hypothetical protein